MKKHHRKSKKVIKLDADFDNELDNYDVSSSDDGLDQGDRILLENARGRRRQKEEEEVLPIREPSSESESSINGEDNDSIDEDEVNEDDMDVEGNEEKSNEDDIYGGGVSSEMDSDIEDTFDGLPDSKAWGSRRKDYYNTDYVDKDYSGFDDEEAAIMEEQEAKVIQNRLLGNLEETDFTMGLLDMVEEKRKEALTKNIKLEIEKKIEIDRTKLTETELKEFDEKETPGFNKIMENVRNYDEYARNIIYPILNYAEASKMESCPALYLIKKKYYTICRYSMNFIFLLILKACRTSNIARHPVINRLHEINKHLQEIDALENGRLRKQMVLIAKTLTQNKGKNKEKVVPVRVDKKINQIDGKNRKERRKKMLQILAERNVHDVFENKTRKVKFADELGSLPLETYSKQFEEANEEETEEIDNAEEPLDGTEKRAATYQMLKNKGLTPKRKKEMRNPRVRNKNKFKKAVVRRKGQVKVSRKELKKYDGEISGIKKNLSRSIKLK